MESRRKTFRTYYNICIVCRKIEYCKVDSCIQYIERGCLYSQQYVSTLLCMIKLPDRHLFILTLMVHYLHKVKRVQLLILTDCTYYTYIVLILSKQWQHFRSVISIHLIGLIDKSNLWIYVNIDIMFVNLPPVYCTSISIVQNVFFSF